MGVGLEGLHDELRPGRLRIDKEDKVSDGSNRALQNKSTAAPPARESLLRGSLMAANSPLNRCSGTG